MSNSTAIQEILRQIALKKQLPISAQKIAEITDSLQTLKGIATKSSVKSIVGIKDIALKNAIDTSDVDFWIQQIIDILNK